MKTLLTLTLLLASTLAFGQNLILAPQVYSSPEYTLGAPLGWTAAFCEGILTTSGDFNVTAHQMIAIQTDTFVYTPAFRYKATWLSGPTWTTINGVETITGQLWGTFTPYVKHKDGKWVLDKKHERQAGAYFSDAVWAPETGNQGLGCGNLQVVF